jgi:predicted metalloprotease
VKTDIACRPAGHEEPTWRWPVAKRVEGQRRRTMADNSGGMGLAGVLIGALLVVVIGGGLLMMSGVIGKQNNSTVSIQVPKVLPTK